MDFVGISLKAQLYSNIICYKLYQTLLHPYNPNFDIIVDNFQKGVANLPNESQIQLILTIKNLFLKR
ncbi:hypothetical protein C1A40_11025 [Tamlana carrageenivorans]|uniref:Uncharacterized protein n=1 Tax=Pseudotamlana carrageenivorans TaxID=2069432 RepID=A0A2I7SJ61_9FLAO|nr:hypothetical protein C1A40_11025 [Tamlana carrageenivorans]